MKANRVRICMFVSDAFRTIIPGHVPKLHHSVPLPTHVRGTRFGNTVFESIPVDVPWNADSWAMREVYNGVSENVSNGI